jgi:hypothetical protein
MRVNCGVAQTRMRILVFLVSFLATLFVLPDGQAQDLFATNLADLGEQTFSSEHSLWESFYPWDARAYSLSGDQWWWVDCNQLPCDDLFQVSTNLESCGVRLAAVVLTKNLLTGETILQPDGVTDIVAVVPAPSGYQPGAGLGVNTWVWWQYREAVDCPECWGIESEIPPPTVTLSVLLADINDYATYAACQSNAEARAKTEAAESAEEAPKLRGAGGMMLAMGSSECDTDDFRILDIQADEQGRITIGWCGATNWAYEIQAASEMANAIWQPQTVVAGEGYLSWTDTNAAAFDHRFYRLRVVPAYNGLFSFTVNGGAQAVFSPLVQIEFPEGIVASDFIVSEDANFETSATNDFAWSSDYSLLNTNDGLRTLYIKLLYADGTTSAAFSWTFELDTRPPLVSINSPTNGTVTARRRINIEGFAADASPSNAAQTDASRWLQVTVNGDFVNERDADGLWWSGLHDLTPGTNTFVVVAKDQASNAATSSVWFWCTTRVWRPTCRCSPLTTPRTGRSARRPPVLQLAAASTTTTQPCKLTSWTRRITRLRTAA